MSRCPCCGTDITNDNSRSIPQLRRYFAMVRAAFTHWPEGHELQPRNSEELRKWLQAKCGYRRFIVLKVDPDNLPMVRSAMKALLELMDDYAWPVALPDGIAVVASESIRFDKMPHSEFCKLCDDVASRIEQEIGASIEEIMKERA